MLSVLNEAASTKGSAIKDLEYFVISMRDNGYLTVTSTLQISMASLIKNMLPSLVIFMLKDNFSDFEGLKVLAPAREEAMKLLA